MSWFTLNIDRRNFDVLNHPISPYSTSTVTFDRNGTIEPGHYSIIKLLTRGKECYLNDGWDKNLIDEKWWVWWEAPNWVGFYWDCSQY